MDFLIKFIDRNKLTIAKMLEDKRYKDLLQGSLNDINMRCFQTSLAKIFEELVSSLNKSTLYRKDLIFDKNVLFNINKYQTIYTNELNKFYFKKETKESIDEMVNRILKLYNMEKYRENIIEIVFKTKLEEIITKEDPKFFSTQLVANKMLKLIIEEVLKKEAIIIK
jgi:acetyl-CoA carboxylase beta subunit